MARIPLSGFSVNLQPVASGEGAEEFVQARGLSRMAESTAALADQQAADHARMERSDAMTALLKGVNDELEAIQADPNRIDGVADGFEEKFSRQANDLMEGLTSGPQAQLQFRDAAVDLIRKGRGSAFETEFSRKSKRAGNQLQVELEEIGRNTFAIDTVVAMETVETQIEEAVASYAAAGYTDASGAEILIRKELESVQKTAIARRYGSRQFALLHEEIVSGFYKHVSEQDLAQADSAARAGQSTLNASLLEKAVLLNPLSLSRERIYAGAEGDPFQGGITTDQANSVYSLWENEMRQRRSEVDLEMLGESFLRDDNPTHYEFTDKTHKKALNLVTQTRAAAQGIEWSVADPRWRAMVSDIAGRSGGVAESARSLILGVINSPSADTNTRYQASALLHGLKMASVTVEKQFAKDTDTLAAMDFAEELLDRVKSDSQGRQAPPDTGEILRQMDEEMVRSIAKREVPLELEEFTEGESFPKWALEQTLSGTVFDTPAANIRLGTSAGPLTGGLFGLLDPTLEDALDEMRGRGNPELPGEMSVDLEEAFKAQLRRAGTFSRLKRTPEDMLKNAWNSVLTQWGLSELMTGDLSWQLLPIDMQIRGEYAAFYHDLTDEVQKQIAFSYPEGIDLRSPEPNFGERLEALWHLQDPFGFRAQAAGQPGEIGGLVEHPERMLGTLGAVAAMPVRATDALFLALLDIHDPQKSDFARRIVETLYSAGAAKIDEKEIEGARSVAGTAKRAKEMLNEGLTTVRRIDGAQEVVRRGPMVGTLSSIFGIKIGPDLQVELHPSSFRLGEPKYQIRFLDSDGNPHTLRASPADSNSALYSWSPETSPTLLKKREAELAGMREGAADLLQDPEMVGKFFGQGEAASAQAQKAVEAIRLYRDIRKNQSVEEQLFMPPDITYQRISRDPALAYAYLQIAREIQLKRRSGEDTAQLDAELSQRKRAIDRTPPRALRPAP